MKLKSIFGAILTVLGIAGLIYAAYLYVNDAAGLRALLVYGILGFIFFRVTHLNREQGFNPFLRMGSYKIILAFGSVLCKTKAGPYRK